MATTEAHFHVEATAGNHFAWMRTMLALQRTLMAAVRTAVSLIGFGFTVAQFFEKMRSNMPEGMRGIGINIPRDLGLLLIGAGVVSLMIFTWEYRTAASHLQSDEYSSIAVGKTTLHRPTYIVAFAVIVIGIAAFVSVFLRF